jgi:hypothetical protein
MFLRNWKIRKNDTGRWKTMIAFIADKDNFEDQAKERTSNVLPGSRI